MDPSQSRKSLSRYLKTGALVAGVVAASVIPSTAFAKGNPAHKGGGGTSAGTCWVTPNPVPLGAQWDISGSGYAPNEILQQWTVDSQATMVTFVGADANGTFTGATGWANATGNYTVYVKDSASGATLSSCTFIVS